MPPQVINNQLSDRQHQQHQVTNKSSSSSSSSSTNKYSTTYQTIRRLLKEDDNYVNNNNYDSVAVRNDMARLDELRRIICSSWVESNYCCGGGGGGGGVTTEADTTSSTPASSSTIEKWYTFLRNSRMILVNQLCHRISTVSFQQHPHLHHVTVVVCRALWGVIAGTPILIESRTVKPNETTHSQQQQQQQQQIPMVDVQLILRFVRAIAGHSNHTEMTNEDDGDHDNDDIDTNTNMNESNHHHVPWKIRDDKQLSNMIINECIQPYRDVQYYIMSSICTVCNEIYTSNTTTTTITTITTMSNSSRSNRRNGKYNTYGIARMMELLVMIVPPLKTTTTQEFQSTAKSIIVSSMVNPSNTLRSSKKTARRPTNDKDDLDSDDEVDSDDASDEEDDDDENSEEENDEESDDDGYQGNTDKRSNNNNTNGPSYQNKKRFVNMMSKVWFALLRIQHISDDDDMIKQSLLYLPKYILPITSTPLRFADFFHRAYGSHGPSTNQTTTTTATTTTTTTTTTASTVSNSNTIIPILALEGLFYLMMEHGLEYQNYYKQLYCLLRSSSIYYIKYRITFLKLLYNSIIKNDTLPTHIVAAYTKRLLRQSLYASPSTIMYLLTFVSNVLRKHPEMTCLIHRGSDGSSTGDGNNTAKMDDPYDADTDDPELCNALQSSLWELNALQYHYYSGVVTVAKSIGTENYKQTLPYDCTGEFLTITYTTLFEQERTRNKKQQSGVHTTNNSEGTTAAAVDNKRRRDDESKDASRKNKNHHTPLAFHTPTTLFSSTDIFSAILSIPRIKHK